MDVVQGAAKYSAQQHGQTHYFCSAGCLNAFQSDPAKYLNPDFKASMFGAMVGRVRGFFGGKHP
jgi:YHS domain-containing protein